MYASALSPISIPGAPTRKLPDTSRFCCGPLAAAVAAGSLRALRRLRARWPRGHRLGAAGKGGDFDAPVPRDDQAARRLVAAEELRHDLLGVSAGGDRRRRDELDDRPRLLLPERKLEQVRRIELLARGRDGGDAVDRPVLHQPSMTAASCVRRQTSSRRAGKPELLRGDDERHARQRDPAGALERFHSLDDLLANALALVLVEPAEDHRDRPGSGRQELPVVVRIRKAPRDFDLVDPRLRKAGPRDQAAQTNLVSEGEDPWSARLRRRQVPALLQDA